MARKHPPQRQSKSVYYFIVEGCTEENYLKLLKTLYHKDATLENCKGGSAKAVLEKAEKRITQSELYSGYIVWFDQDTFDPATDTHLKKSLIAKKNVEIYISQPCVEQWLLAHFQSINLQSNETCKFFEKTLNKHIPNYKKNDCLLLKNHINKTEVETAIKNYPDIGQIPKKYFVTEVN